MGKRGVRVTSVAVGIVAGGVCLAAPAYATVSATSAAWTPQIVSSDSIVRQLVQCGSTMYAVGTFSSVRQGGTTYSRSNAFSFSALNGTVTAWNPKVNAEVNSIALSPDCGTAYVGGKFTEIGSTSVAHLAAVSTSTGQVLTGFKHSASGVVETIAMVNQGQDLLVGGLFGSINGSTKHYYASLDPGTGTVNSYLQVTVSGRLPPDAGPTTVYNQQLSPSGDRLLFEGKFTQVSGQPRLQMAELNIGASAATLNGFYNQKMNTTYCSTAEQFYVRTAAFSPDEQTVYIATTGAHGTSPFCDAATAFTNTANATVKWINYTGGDSLYAVAAGPLDLYVGGHERWADNQKSASDYCAPGCVSRPGIGDIGVTTGKATSWDPTRSRGKGADDMLLTPAGLWIASDNFYGSYYCAHAYHPGICFLPGV